MSTVSSAHRLPAVKDLMGQREQKINTNDQHEQSLGALERLALSITNHIGTMGFFFIIFSWTCLWMGWNALAQQFHWPGVFDRPWDFAVWLFISNLIQIHLMPLIMIGQNLQARHAELRAEQAFQLTEQADREMAAALHYLETIQNSLTALDQRLQALEKKLGGSA